MLHFLCIYLQASPQNDLMFYELSCEFMVPRLKLCVWVKWWHLTVAEILLRESNKTVITRTRVKSNLQAIQTQFLALDWGWMMVEWEGPSPQAQGAEGEKRKIYHLCSLDRQSEWKGRGKSSTTGRGRKEDGKGFCWVDREEWSEDRLEMLEPIFTCILHYWPQRPVSCNSWFFNKWNWVNKQWISTVVLRWRVASQQSRWGVTSVRSVNTPRPGGRPWCSTWNASMGTMRKIAQLDQG